MYTKVSDEAGRLLITNRAQDVIAELRQIADLLGYESFFEQSAKTPVIIPKHSLDHLRLHVDEYNEALKVLNPVK